MKNMSHLTKEQRRLFDKRCPEYIPTYEEIGISEEQEMSVSDEEVERRRSEFRKNHIANLELRKVNKTLQRDLDLSTHWYYMSSQQEIEQALKRLSLRASEIIEDINSKETLPSKVASNYNLLNRILNQDPKYRPAMKHKVALFPQTFVNGEIIGSKKRLLALWYFIYSLRR